MDTSHFLTHWSNTRCFSISIQHQLWKWMDSDTFKPGRQRMSFITITWHIKNFMKWNLITKSTKPVNGKRKLWQLLDCSLLPIVLVPQIVVHKQAWRLWHYYNQCLYPCLCNHDLASPCTPSSCCYHHPSYRLQQQSKMPTTESEYHLSQQLRNNYFETIPKISLHYPNSSTDTLELANAASRRATQNDSWLNPRVKDWTKTQDY